MSTLAGKSLHRAADLIDHVDLTAAPGLAAGSTFRIIDNSGNNTATTGTFAVFAGVVLG